MVMKYIPAFDFKFICNTSTCTVMYMYMTHIDIYLYEFQPFHSTMVNFNTGWCPLINIETNRFLTIYETLSISYVFKYNLW